MLPTDAPRFWPRFRSTIRSTALTARVGRVLGICLSVCFVTGMLSHYQYHPWSWLPVPSWPVWGYRLTQGVHVLTGTACIPLLLVKLWSVYPRLYAWPPVRGAVHALERLSIGVLVASALVQLVTGLMNSLGWYAFHWPFVDVHRYLAYVLIGALALHVAVKLPVIRAALAAPLADGERSAGITRRGVLLAAGAAVGLVAVTEAGQTVTPLARFGLLAIRKSHQGPQGLPVNKTAAQARVSRVDDGWELDVRGPRPLRIGLAQLERDATHAADLPIACVEGWSAGASWRGVRLIDVVRRAGGDAGSTVRVTSMQRGGSYGTSTITGPQLIHALLATHLNGERLDLDHGYPVRLIAPDRAGVLNTKWIERIEVRR